MEILVIHDHERILAVLQPVPGMDVRQANMVKNEAKLLIELFEMRGYDVQPIEEFCQQHESI